MAATPTSDSPGRLETWLAYAGAALSSLVWVGCVIPGVPVDPGTSDDAATPMGIAAGALLLVPALLLLVAGPVATVLTRGALAHRALLAAGDAFVAWFVAGVLFFAARHRDPAMVLVIVALSLMGLVALRDAFVVLTSGADDPEGEGGHVSLRSTDLRLALSILALLTPASLLTVPERERASLLAPFVYITISALGERFATTERGLRLTGAVLLSLVATHLVIALRYVLDHPGGGAGAWTWSGTATFALAVAVLATGVARAVAIARSPCEALA